MNTLRVRIKPYIQPFERVLALKELRILTGVEPRALGLFEETSTDFEIRSMLKPQFLAGRLAYWEAIEQDRHSVITNQSLRESTVNVIRNGGGIDALRQQLPFKDDVPLPNRRCLRYGPHGLHEYRGKFFPQLVCSLINISGIPPGATIADPMSGSGTTVVESILGGYQGLGLDMNPLSVFIGNTKAALLSANVTRLAACFEQIRLRLSAAKSRGKRLTYLESLPLTDQNYLASWFSRHVLSELDDISVAIAGIEYGQGRDLMRVALSNILRSVSWQKRDDLRVRKEIRPDTEIVPKNAFLEELERSARSVLAFLLQNGALNNAQFRILESDARRCRDAWGDRNVDLIITSPPYATALPYLDTDRLSLCYLGLLPRPEHRAREQIMIGNREVTEKLRKSLWAVFETKGNMLPKSVGSLIRRINSLNLASNAGFRRRNLPALLAKYFFDMYEVLSGLFESLKPGCFAYVVVGNNHTIAGGERVEICTSALLRDIAYDVGFEVAESLSMEMLVSRDIFKKNVVASEEILSLRRPFQM